MQQLHAMQQLWRMKLVLAVNNMSDGVVLWRLPAAGQEKWRERGRGEWEWGFSKQRAQHAHAR
jgi:hypothetical protein